jgi:hypothetical protein
MKKFSMLHRSHFIQWLSLLLGVSLLLGCSLVRVGYNHGNSLVYWWADAYIDFDAGQQPWVKNDIDNLLQWHRKTQLPQYAQFLGQVQHQMQGPLSRTDLQADFDQIEHYTQMLLLKATPELTDLALALHETQLTQLAKKFKANNDEFIQEHLHDSIEKQQKRRYKKVLKEAQSWFGGMSDAQEEQIRQWSDARPLQYDIWLEERMRRQQKMLTLLHRLHEDKPNRDAAMMMVHDFIATSFEHHSGPANQAYFDAYNETSTLMVLGIVNQTTPQQKALAAKKLQGWIDDCHFLAAQDG